MTSLRRLFAVPPWMRATWSGITAVAIYNAAFALVDGSSDMAIERDVVERYDVRRAHISTHQVPLAPWRTYKVEVDTKQRGLRTLAAGWNIAVPWFTGVDASWTYWRGSGQCIKVWLPLFGELFTLDRNWPRKGAPVEFPEGEKNDK